jgi:hypothetical protein
MNSAAYGEKKTICFRSMLHGPTVRSRGTTGLEQSVAGNCRVPAYERSKKPAKQSTDRPERSCSPDAPLGYWTGQRDRAHETRRWVLGQAREIVLTRHAAGPVDRPERSCSPDAPLGYWTGPRDRAHETLRWCCGQAREIVLTRQIGGGGWRE